MLEFIISLLVVVIFLLICLVTLALCTLFVRWVWYKL